jgi:hypothetical protein
MPGGHEAADIGMDGQSGSLDGAPGRSSRISEEGPLPHAWDGPGRMGAGVPANCQIWGGYSESVVLGCYVAARRCRGSVVGGDIGFCMQREESIWMRA